MLRHNLLDRTRPPAYDGCANWRMASALAKARRSIDTRLLLPNGCLLHLRVWEVPEPVPPSAHLFKYSLFYGRPGERLVLYDNERGKGDHRHLRELEMPYRFTTRERLIADFLADVQAIRAEEEQG